MNETTDPRDHGASERQPHDPAPTTAGAPEAHGTADPYVQAPYGQAPYGRDPRARAPYLQAPYAQVPHAQAPYAQAYGAGAHPHPQSPGAVGPGPLAGEGPEGEGAFRRRRRRLLAVAAGASALALALGFGGFATGYGVGRLGGSGSGYEQAGSGSAGAPGFGSRGQSGLGEGPLPNGDGSGGSTSGGSGTSAQLDLTPATDAQKTGVVTIVSELDYGQGEAAGTGIILDAEGVVLTNNHVIEGATSIQVTDELTGRSYTASVVGTDATDDVAVLQLANASGLATATLDTDDDVMVGDTVTDVGNAEGTGDLVATTGTVADLDQTITVSDESTGASKTLSGLVEIDADVVSGDSGGPVLDEDGDVVGIATAASEGSSQITGFAIPIATALSVARQIEAGQASDTVRIGLPPFLGVELAGSGAQGSGGLGTSSEGSSAGAVVGGVIAGTPAAEAGLVAGDTIVSVDGVAVSSGDELSAAIGSHAPGDRVTIGYLDASGANAQVTVTLIGGPAA